MNTEQTTFVVSVGTGNMSNAITAPLNVQMVPSVEAVAKYGWIDTMCLGASTPPYQLS